MDNVIELKTNPTSTLTAVEVFQRRYGKILEFKRTPKRNNTLVEQDYVTSPDDSQEYFEYSIQGDEINIAEQHEIEMLSMLTECIRQHGSSGLAELADVTGKTNMLLAAMRDLDTEED